MQRPVMKTIPVQKAVGTVLCHDITRIVPGGEKGPAFRKGHVVRKEDIATLLKLGKENLYVFEDQPGFVHENDAAKEIVECIRGRNLISTEPKEGRIDLKAACDGLLQVDVETLMAINMLGEITLATLHGQQFITKGRSVAGTRVVPLLIAQEKLQALKNLVKHPVLEILPLRAARVGLVTTGSEVSSGRIDDAFGPILRKKFSALGSTVVEQAFTGDDASKTAQAIRAYLAQGLDLIAVTGGMSVDPDDRTPRAIRESGAEIVCYGAPVYPGAMFLLAWAEGIHGRVPIVGLPGCVMYYKASIFDLIVPRLLAGADVTVRDIAGLGHGSFCSQCAHCRYPICPFGK
ncbi:MAG: molybdopterin-binding protein [Desulfovibrio sp.]|nr:molybdopterin-binding protein [Desulfovibrio sp.]